MVVEEEAARWFEVGAQARGYVNSAQEVVGTVARFASGIIVIRRYSRYYIKCNAQQYIMYVSSWSGLVREIAGGRCGPRDVLLHTG